MSDTTSLTKAELEAIHGSIAVAHSVRFRRVSNHYPHVVAQAYDGHLMAAAVDSDEQVAETVAWWERTQGLEPRDWHAIGREEREESPAA